MSKSNAHLVHTSRQVQYSPSAHLLRHRCQYSPNAHLVLTQYTSDNQLIFCSPFPFCNAHLVPTCNAHLIRCVLGEHWVRIEWELTFHFCLGTFQIYGKSYVHIIVTILRSFYNRIYIKIWLSHVTLNPIYIFNLVAFNHELASMFSGSNWAACEQLTSNR